MFDSVVLNVVISLVFIYLIYSLLVTVLGEIVSSLLKLRSALLKKSIERMLNDGISGESKKSWFMSLVEKIALIFNAIRKGSKLSEEGKKKWWYKIVSEQLKENSRAKAEKFESSFAGRFYNAPAIKYLTQEKKTRKPVRQAKEPSYISSSYFAQTMIHLFRYMGSGADDSEKVEFALKYNTLDIEPETLLYIKNLFIDAGGNISNFMQNLMKWFDETMDRTNGWYKRNLKKISFVLGLIIAVAFNLDSIKLVGLLSTDAGARDQLVAMGIAAAKDSAKFNRYIDRSGDTVSTAVLIDSSLKSISSDIKKANLVMGPGWNFSKLQPGTSKAKTSWDKKSLFILGHLLPWTTSFWGLLITALMLSLGAPFWFDLLKRLVAIRGAGVKPEEKENKEIVPEPAFENRYLSQMAPAKTLAENPVDTAKRIYGDRIKKETGVIDISSGYEKGSLAKEQYLQVDVLNQETASLIRSKYSTLLAGEGSPVKMKVVVTGQKLLRAGNAAGSDMQETETQTLPEKKTTKPQVKDTSYLGIWNEQKLSYPGSFGCLVNRVDFKDEIFILTCYHVVNADLTWKNDGKYRVINFKDGTAARNYEGHLTNLLDVALVGPIEPEIKNYFLEHAERFPERDTSVSLEDVHKTEVTIRGFKTPWAKGVIVHDSKSVAFKYPLGGSKYLEKQINDLIVISHDKSLSEEYVGTVEGDSGALVVDQNNRALGILVGGDFLHSYAIKLSNIKELVGLEVYQC